MLTGRPSLPSLLAGLRLLLVVLLLLSLMLVCVQSLRAQLAQVLLTVAAEAVQVVAESLLTVLGSLPSSRRDEVRQLLNNSLHRQLCRFD